MDRVLELNYIAHLPADKFARILDFGCGEGRVLKFLESQGYQNFLGVDIDTVALENLPLEIRAKTERLGRLEDFVQKHHSRFDCIILKDVIYYFNRSTAADNLRLILRALKPGGSVVIEVFNGAQLTSNFTAAKDLGIQTVYTEASLRQLLTACGLTVHTLFEQRQARGGIKFWLYRLGQRLYFAVLRAVFILERGADSNNPTLFGKSLIAVARKA